MRIEEIWPRYQSRLRRFLRARMASPEDAEDLLQEISIKVFTGLPQLKDSARLQSWLFQIAQRSIADYYRQRSRAAQPHPDDLWHSRDDPAARQELEACVEPFLQSLPPETADLLRAIDLQGISQRDYATAQGLAYSTLKSRVQGARAALRQSFEDCCSFTLDARGSISGYQEKSPGSAKGCKKC